MSDDHRGGVYCGKVNAKNSYGAYIGDRLFAVVFIDITELKNSQLQCKISEDMYKKAFMASHDAVVISRLKDGKIYSINRSFTNFAGYTEEDLKDKIICWGHRRRYSRRY